MVCCTDSVDCRHTQLVTHTAIRIPGKRTFVLFHFALTQGEFCYNYVPHRIEIVITVVGKLEQIKTIEPIGIDTLIINIAVCDTLR